jgi:hypothetical protein
VIRGVQVYWFSDRGPVHSGSHGRARGAGHPLTPRLPVFPGANLFERAAEQRDAADKVGNLLAEPPLQLISVLCRRISITVERG